MTVTIRRGNMFRLRGGLVAELCELFNHPMLFGTATSDLAERWCLCCLHHHVYTNEHRMMQRPPQSRLGKRREKRADAVARNAILNGSGPGWLVTPYKQRVT